MATISGSLRFVSDRSAVSSPSLPGIADVPITLQNTDTNIMLSVYTHADGSYSFHHVPDGNYRIVESYGVEAASSPGDFDTAVIGSEVVGALPPIKQIKNLMPSATNLSATLPLTRIVTVSGTDLTSQDFLNEAIVYTPLQSKKDKTTLAADLNISETADPNPVRIGEILTYSLTITNSGSDAFHAVTITDEIPDSITNVEYSYDSGSLWQSWKGCYTLDFLAGNSSAVLLIRGTVSPNASGLIVNTARISSSLPVCGGSNSCTIYTQIIPFQSSADLTISNAVCPHFALPGDTIVYKLVITNKGSLTAENVVLTDNLPDAISHASYWISHDKIWQTWSGRLMLGSLRTNASVTLLIQGVISNDAKGFITNYAEVTSSTTGNHDFKQGAKATISILNKTSF